MKWIVPPVRKPLVPDIAKHSATTPWPANAASPCSSSGSTDVRFTLSPYLRLLGARLAEHHRIDRFEMRGIGGQRQMHVVAVERAVRRCAEVILHVARALHVRRLRRAALEFVEELAIGLAHHVDEHVQAPAMRHAEHDVLDAQRAAALDDLLHRRDRRFAAVEPEALGADEFHAAEFLEDFGFDQLVQDRALAFARERDLVLGALDPPLKPFALLGIGDVHVLVADRAAIGAPQDLDQLRAA